MPHDEEYLWVQRSQAGDRSAFALLVDRYWSRIYRWLYGLTGAVPVAEDLTQEAFLKAWSRLTSFQAGTQFRAWLYQIARHALIDWQRRSRHQPNQTLLEVLPDREPGPVATVLDRETQTLVRQAVERLPLLFREPFLLRTQEDLGYTEIARILELTEETVRWRVCKARQMLLQELKSHLDREKP